MIVVSIILGILLLVASASMFFDRSLIKKMLPVVIGLLIAVILTQSFVIIPTGYSGVRTTFGQIDPNTVQSGFIWKIPFAQHIEKVNNKQQDIKFDKKGSRVWSETAQRTAVFYEDITVTYRINSTMSAWIYANVSDYRKSLINEGIVASAIKASSKELSDVDATNRSIIEPLSKERLQSALDSKYGVDVVIVTKIVIGNTDFEESYSAAIAEKQQAQIAAEQQEIENERAIKKAEADATVARTQASAQADVELIRAEATAEANRMLQESLSEKIISSMWIEKWDGKTPLYITGGQSDTMIGIGVPDAVSN